MTTFKYGHEESNPLAETDLYGLLIITGYGNI